MLEGRAGEDEEAPAYQPVVPDLWRIPDALARIRALLADNPEGGDLAGFLHTDLVFECAVLRSLSIPTSVRSDYA